MTRTLLLLVVGLPLLVGLLVAVPAGLVLGPAHWTFAAVAFGLCVPPGLAVVLLAEYLSRTSQYGRVVAVFAGTGIRMAVGFGGGVLFYLAAGPEDKAGKVAFWLWVLFAYITALVVETVLLAGKRK